MRESVYCLEAAALCHIFFLSIQEGNKSMKLQFKKESIFSFYFILAVGGNGEKGGCKIALFQRTPSYRLKS